MLNKTSTIAAVACLTSIVLSVSCASASSEEKPPAVEKIFTNPVYQPDFPDPTVIRAADGWFYAYSTQSRRSGKVVIVPVIRSRDMVNWEEVGGALSQLPTWKTTEGGGVWAPNINFIDGKYYLYYSFAKWEDTNEGVGLAISDSPGGPFRDMGKMFDVQGIGVENCIDPFYFHEDGIHYLFFGSHAGLYGIELNEDATAIKGAKFKVAANGIEAIYIYKRNGWYYMFGSNGKCCIGDESSYKVSVSRSRNLKGPYMTKEGTSMLTSVKTEPILKGGDTLIGPGHNGEIILDDNGDEWIIYHTIVKGDATRKDGGGTWRRLAVDRIHWDAEDWCVIGTGTPTAKPQPYPLFK